MLITIFSSILFLIFSVLGGFHFYWLLGGTWGLKSAIPTKTKAPNSMRIPRFATLLVGLILVSFGLLYLVQSDIITYQLPEWITTYVYWFIPSAFILRAIGEFKYVGFFKSIKDTEFGRADTKVFSPLCTAIGAMGFLIQFTV